MVAFEASMDEPEDVQTLPTGVEGERQRLLAMRKVGQLTGLLAAVFAVLFVLSLVVIARSPGPKATDQELIDFYESDDKRRFVLVALYVLPFAAVAFLWFLAILREWVYASSRRANRLLSNVQMVSGVSFITLTFAAAAASTALAASVEFTDTPIDPSDARQFPIFGDVMLFIFGMRMAAIFVTSTTNIVRPSGYFPRWFVFFSYAVAAFLFLSASLNLWLVLAFPIWMLIFGGLIVFKARAIPTDPEAVSEAAARSLLNRASPSG
jgi:hypothetical protein